MTTPPWPDGPSAARSSGTPPDGRCIVTPPVRRRGDGFLLGVGNVAAMDLDGAMGVALEEARLAVTHGDVPIGAVVLKADGTVLARRHNERELQQDPTAHAEILAIRDAARALGHWRLTDATMVVTLEPCPMCAGAIWAARFGKLVFAAADPKAGATGSLYNLCVDPRLNHELPVESGVRSDDAAALLSAFFAERRER